MESYIVRIYKSGEYINDEAEIIRGVIEDPSTGLKIGFESIEDLWAIMGSSPRKFKSIKSFKKKEEGYIQEV